MNTVDQLSGQTALSDLQRIQAFVERGHVKICLERFDDHLGWYAAGSLVLPAEQVPVLQQTLQRIVASEIDDDAPANIITLSSFLASGPA